MAKVDIFGGSKTFEKNNRINQIRERNYTIQYLFIHTIRVRESNYKLIVK